MKMHPGLLHIRRFALASTFLKLAFTYLTPAANTDGMLSAYYVT